VTASTSKEALYRRATAAAWLGFSVNLLLGAVKLVGGLFSGSFGLLSDALHSLGDALTSGVVLFAFRFAQRPPDAEHPYGHTRAEAIAGSNVALLLIVSALAVGWEAVQHWHDPHEPPPVWALGIAAGSIAIQEALFRYERHVARRTGSAALLANAWDHRNDALCSLAVLIGLALVRWGGPAWSGADHAAALLIVGAIIWTGLRLFRSSASELMDLQAAEPLVRHIREVAASVPEVRGVEKLRVRKSGLEYFADIHIEVDPQMTVAEGHRIGHVVKDRLLSEFSQLRDVLVHLEPFAHEPAVKGSSRTPRRPR
jgi:cation diffusion facilitator family transporter